MNMPGEPLLIVFAILKLFVEVLNVKKLDKPKPATLATILQDTSSRYKLLD